MVIAIVTSILFMQHFFTEEVKPNDSLKTHVSMHIKKLVVPKPKQVHVWGKAAISEYFWKHIIEGVTQPSKKYMWDEGIMQINNVKLIYSTGPSLLPETAPKNIRDLVIILNGREEKNVHASLQWLNALNQEFSLLQNIGIIILGNERCNNSWLVDLCKQSRLIKFVFIVYDINLHTPPCPFYQWPLGVATYRKFPLIKKKEVDLHTQRKYFCNFLGTVYTNSSRTQLNSFLNMGRLQVLCFTKVRYSWLLKETKETFELYHNILKQSDLTLCPVGFNSESYRIYEAMSYGSIPVIEDVMTEGQCSGDLNNDLYKAPFRLLKKYNAPVIFVKNWTELFTIIEAESKMSLNEKVRRREDILRWYEGFRSKMRDVFLDILNSKFE